MGIAFGKDGMWAVADHSNHCVYIFDSQDQVVRKIGSKGKGNGEFDKPVGLVFSDDNNFSYVVCISYNTGKSALPDIYTQCPRAHSTQGQVRIYQAKHECLL